MNITNCTDLNVPLSYKFAYYTSAANLQADLLASNTANLNTLADF